MLRQSLGAAHGLCLFAFAISQSFAQPGAPEFKTNVTLIYNDDVKNLTLAKIISNFSNWEDKRTLPVFQMDSKGDFPIEETLLPLFKRRLISFINHNKLNTEFQRLVEKKED